MWGCSRETEGRALTQGVCYWGTELGPHFVHKESRAQRHCLTSARSHSGQQGTRDQCPVPKREAADGKARGRAEGSLGSHYPP